MVALLSITSPVAAQNRTPKSKTFTPPKVQTILGIRHNGDSVYLEEAVQLAGVPLKVADSSGNEYAVYYYHFAYRQKSFLQDPESGKVIENFTLVSSPFYDTPLPDVWVENMQASLKKGEQLHFFDILVKDKQGRTFRAPELIITVK